MESGSAIEMELVEEEVNSTPSQHLLFSSKAATATTACLASLSPLSVLSATPAKTLNASLLPFLSPFSVLSAASVPDKTVKILKQTIQDEREALSVNALAQIRALATKESPDSEEMALVNALIVDHAPPPLGTSDVWKSFRKYSKSKRDGFAVCQICKSNGQSNWDSEVNYGASHSTSKLGQHLKAIHKEEHKRNVESFVEGQRKQGNTLLAALNVAPGLAAVDDYIEFIALACQPLDLCENEHFRKMITSLNQKSALGMLSARSAKEMVIFWRNEFLSETKIANIQYKIMNQYFNYLIFHDLGCSKS